MIPVFVYAYATERPTHYFAFAIYAVSQGTDALDGYIARKYNMITRLGRVLDPLADKMMSFTALVCIVATHAYIWWAAVVMFLKEVLMGIGVVLHYKKIAEVPSSNIFGKLSTIYFYLMFIAVLLFDKDFNGTVMIVLCAVGVTLTLVAFVTYAADFIRLIKVDTKKPDSRQERDEA
jgi:CDP-diacylglycerol--glycerol-3-phosphate 3-phosphatidyltransferase